MKPFIFYLIVLFLNLTSPCLAQLKISEGLVLYYNFDQCDATDNSGNNNHGGVNGSPICTNQLGGKGLWLNQKPGYNSCGQKGGEYIKLPTLGAIWKNGFTVCAWVKYENIKTYERIIDLGNSNGEKGGLNVWFGRRGSTNDLTLESWVDNNPNTNRDRGRLIAYDVITNGDIEFYCATIENDVMKIYVNGKLVASKKGHPIANVKRSRNYIGHSNWCNADPDFKGFLDEIRVYNRALTLNEINALSKNTGQELVANSGKHSISANSGDLITLDGTNSYSIYGKKITFDWKAPSGIKLSDCTSPQPTFKAPIVGVDTEYPFMLTVTDGVLVSEPDTIIVKIEKTPAEPLNLSNDIIELINTKAIYFENNSSTLNDESKKELLSIIALLKNNKGFKLNIEGFADKTGNNTSNQKLSASRAKEVYLFLVEHKIEKNRLTYSGNGISTDSPDLSKNRRVRFSIINN